LTLRKPLPPRADLRIAVATTAHAANTVGLAYVITVPSSPFACATAYWTWPAWLYFYGGANSRKPAAALALVISILLLVITTPVAGP
jgi:hypothetical protein